MEKREFVEKLDNYLIECDAYARRYSFEGHDILLVRTCREKNNLKMHMFSLLIDGSAILKRGSLNWCAKRAYDELFNEGGIIK